MTRLSTNTLVPSLRGPEERQFIPFTVFARVVPDLGSGKRFEMVRDLEKLADLVEDALPALEQPTSGLLFDFAKPVAATYQFGESPARLTIFGNVAGLANIAKTPLDQVRVINSGEYKTGPGSISAPRREPTAALDSAVSELKAILETVVSEIIKIEIAGFTYGQGGRHFPR